MVRLTSSVALQVAPVVQVSRNTATPGPLNVAVVPHEVSLPNVTAGPETWLHLQFPLEHEPLKSNAVGVSAGAHFAWSSPAFAVGLASMVRLMSSVSVQLAAVVQVSRSTATPGPLNVAVVAHEVSLPNVTAGPETWLHLQFPLEHVPLKSKAVGTPVFAHFA